MISFKKITAKYSKKTNKWASKNLSGLFVMNLILLIMVLLNNADYFKPYFYLNINIISLVAFFLSVILLRAKSKTMFIFSFFFWVFAAFLRVMNIELWAERSSIYAFQTLVIGITILLFG